MLCANPWDQSGVCTETAAAAGEVCLCNSSGTYQVLGDIFALIALSKCVMAVPKTMPGVQPVCDSKKNNCLNSELALACSSFRPEIRVYVQGSIHL